MVKKELPPLTKNTPILREAKSENPLINPEEEAKKMFEKEKKKKVQTILYMDYLLRILKGIRIFIYMLIILIALISVVEK